MPAIDRIDPQMPVNQIIHHFPVTVRVFHDVGIDACCGGALPLREAAERHGLDLHALLGELECAVSSEHGDGDGAAVR